MAVARRLLEGDAWIRAGDWQGWDLDQLLRHGCLGQDARHLGFGRIGRDVARRAHGFDMRVAVSSIARARPRDVEESNLRAEYVSSIAIRANPILLRSTCR